VFLTPAIHVVDVGTVAEVPAHTVALVHLRVRVVLAFEPLPRLRVASMNKREVIRIVECIMYCIPVDLLGGVVTP
jgi:hypothetical protein